MPDYIRGHEKFVECFQVILIFIGYIYYRTEFVGDSENSDEHNTNVN